MEKIEMPLGKRVFDVIVSILLLIALSPVIIIIIFAMTIEFLFVPSSRGGFIYHQKRISQGKIFTLYKIRIFKEESLVNAKNGSIHVQTKKLEHDEKNLTCVGSFLKKVYLDELGQLVNVLRGDMSLIGPRPKTIDDYERLSRAGYQSLTILKAGITGYFQSHKGIKLHLNQEQIDMQYAELIRNSPTWKILLYDMKMLLITVLTVLRREGI